MSIFIYLAFIWLLAGVIIVAPSMANQDEISKYSPVLRFIAITLAVITAPMVALSGMVKRR